MSAGIESPENVSVNVCKITSEEFKKVIDYYNSSKTADKRINLTGNADEWIEIVEHDGARGDVGYVKYIRVGDKQMRGNAFRTMIMNACSAGIIGNTMKSHCFSLTVS